VPELPEVETARRQAERHLRGRRILAVATVPDPIVFQGVTPRRFAAALRGRRVVAVRRRGKHLWLELDQRPWPLFHFGMTGSFALYRDDAERPRFWKAELRVEGGWRLALADPRRFGRLRLQRDPESERPLAGLGFDVLDALPPGREIAAVLERRGAAIKSVLLDQSLFAGVGNWIADEVLYQARLDPRRPASSLTAAEIGRLRARLRAVVRRAVEVGADADRFPRTWLFHHRWGRATGARTATGELIAHLTVGGRTTAWVPSRQSQRRRRSRRPQHAQGVDARGPARGRVGRQRGRADE
jgi:formamidopyrimidine-DNA glycosylase